MFVTTFRAIPQKNFSEEYRAPLQVKLQMQLLLR